jgi:hypothetical protein
LLCVFGPLYAIALWLRLIPASKLGKLGVVYDQAGKARIVAMANWWIQISLKPLHLSIFRHLKGMKTDGTFNQLLPLNTIVSSAAPGTTFHCFDLTAATDRIPVLFLSHILTACGIRGDLWMRMMSIPWFYPKDKKFISYSVGQAMGAYSSFAMLAVFNHICVAISARRSGISTFFSDYAV